MAKRSVRKPPKKPIKNSGVVRISIKTPFKTWRMKDYAQANQKFHNQVSRNVAQITLNKMSEDVEEAKLQTLDILATFFQRVVARTPMDEYYSWTEKKLISVEDEYSHTWHTEEIEVLKEHMPDTNVCRYDWKIKLGEKEVTSHDIINALGEGVFQSVNNQGSINSIKEYLINEFGLYTKSGNVRDFRKATIWNENPHFDVLEYGGDSPNAKSINNWPEESEIIKQGDNYEHGVTNYHSVQAPVGMLRITQMELDRMSGSKSNKSLASRYKGTKNQFAKTPSDAMLNQFLKKVESGGVLYYEDIERYIGQR